MKQHIYAQVYTIQLRQDLLLWCRTLVAVPMFGYILNISHYTPNSLLFFFCTEKIYSIYTNKYVFLLSARNEQIERNMCDFIVDPWNSAGFELLSQ